MNSKKCTKCNNIKELELFYKDKSKADGYYCSCKDCCDLKNSLSIQKNRQSYLDRNKRYYKSNKEIMNSKRKARRNKGKPQKVKKTREEKLAYYREYYLKNREKKIKAAVELAKIKRKIDIQFRLAMNLRRRINDFVRGNIKPGSAINDLGCTLDELKCYLEAKFQEGMTWDNYGTHGWHLDHIKALSKFDLTNREQFLKAIHYTNLQPLWAFDNMSKGNR